MPLCCRALRSRFFRAGSWVLGQWVATYASLLQSLGKRVHGVQSTVVEIHASLLQSFEQVRWGQCAGSLVQGPGVETCAALLQSFKEQVL